MKVWHWNCQVHYLSLLTMQTSQDPPFVCSGLVEVVYPDSEPCRFSGWVLLNVYPPIPDRAQSIPSGQGRRVGQSAGTPLPSSAPRHSST